MSTEHQPVQATTTGKNHGATVVKIFTLVFAAGFCVVLGGRISGARQEQAALAEARAKAQQKAGGETSAPTSQLVVKAMPEAWLPRVSVEGTLMAVHEADLAFKASGRLARVLVKPGQYVKQGTTLAALEATEAAASVRAAQASVRVAEAQLSLADDAAKRTTSLVDAGAVGDAAGVQAKGQRTLVVAQLEGARAQVALASAALSNHTLSAPFSGFVTRAPTGPGSVVGAGVPLFHVQDTSVLRLSATVGEGDLALVRLGNEVDVTVGGRTLKGRVTSVLPSVDPQTRRVPFEAEVPNPGDAPVVVGTFVRAAVLGKEPQSVLKLPASARRPGSQDEVMVVVGGKLQTRRVVFVPGADGSLLVRSGLSQSDEVLLTPSAESKDGDSVSPAKKGEQ